MKLKFGAANAKLKFLEKKTGKKLYTFSILSGHTCPYAKDCQSKVVIVNNKKTIVDGVHTQFRCFSASQEALYPSVYNNRLYNTDIVKYAAQNGSDCAAKAIITSIPDNADIIRIHIGGDFQTKAYFQSWLLAAKYKPNIIFYAYTKSLPFWISCQNEIPDNFILTASYGGYKDSLIEQHNLRYAKVVYSVDEADKLGLEIDTNDFHAYNPDSKNQSFALLIHGVQPKGSKAAKAAQLLKGVTHYQ